MTWLARLGIWLAEAGGWTPPVAEVVRLVETDPVAMGIVTAIEAEMPDMIGPKKAREAVRRLREVRPDARTRDLNLIVELAVQAAFGGSDASHIQ